MEEHHAPTEAPTAERLVDHAWMVDCALLLHHRDSAAEAAERLFDELVLHDRAFEWTRRYLDPGTADALATTALSLRAGVRLLAEELRGGTTWPRPVLRSRMEELISAEAAAVGDCACAYVD